MALFKILKGSSNRLTTQKLNEGYCYVTTDEGKFYVDISGTDRICLNAQLADKLRTARTINGTAFDGSSNITTDTWGTARTITIGKTGKSVNGGASVSWTNAEIGATVANSFTNGTTAGPTLTTTVNGVASTAIAIPAASENQSGVITTGYQFIKGDKYFTNAIYAEGLTISPDVTVAAETLLYNPLIIKYRATPSFFTDIGMQPFNSIEADNITKGFRFSRQNAYVECIGEFHFNNKIIGNIESADKVNSSLSIQLNGGNATVFNGSTAKSINITPAGIGAAPSVHTHDYLPLTGGTLTGALNINSSNTNDQRISIMNNASGVIGASLVYDSLSDGASIQVRQNPDDGGYVVYRFNPNGTFNCTTLQCATIECGSLSADIPIPISSGGTGAKNAATARANLETLLYKKYDDGDFQTGAGNGSAWLTYTVSGTNKCQLDLGNDGRLRVNNTEVITVGGGATITGEMTFANNFWVSNGNSASGYVKIWEDNEGGNIEIASPDGSTFQMDAYNNTTFRIFSQQSGSVMGMTLDGTTGALTANKVYGAVWNDYAEYRSTDEDELIPGLAVYSDNSGKLHRCVERLSCCEGIISDTFGFAIGETDTAKTPIAVAGRVLAYPDTDKYSFCAGDAVCAGKNGTISKMTREEIIAYPDRIIGIVSEIPDYETWGSDNIKVYNRIWIRIK